MRIRQDILQALDTQTFSRDHSSELDLLVTLYHP